MLKKLAVIVAAIALSVSAVGGADATTTGKPPVTPAAAAAALPVGQYPNGHVVQCVQTATPFTVKGHSGAESKDCPAGNRKLTFVTTNPGAGPAGPAGPVGPAGAKGDQGETGPAGPKGEAASFTTAKVLPIAETVTLDQVGGAIRTGARPISTTVTLPAGTWHYDFTASFSDTRTEGPDATGSAFLWADLDDDATYDWDSSEAIGATVQTGALMLNGAREKDASGSGLITLDGPTQVKVGAGGYMVDNGSAGSGKVKVSLTAASFFRLN